MKRSLWGIWRRNVTPRIHIHLLLLTFLRELLSEILSKLWGLESKKFETWGSYASTYVGTWGYCKISCIIEINIHVLYKDYPTDSSYKPEETWQISLLVSVGTLYPWQCCVVNSVFHSKWISQCSRKRQNQQDHRLKFMTRAYWASANWTGLSQEGKIMARLGTGWSCCPVIEFLPSSRSLSPALKTCQLIKSGSPCLSRIIFLT